MKPRRQRRQQIALDQRPRAIDAARAIGIRERHAPRGVDENRDDRVARRQPARAHHRPHQAEDEPQQRRQPQDREQAPPRRGDRHVAVREPRDEQRGGDHGGERPRRQRIGETHFFFVVAIDSKYFETRSRYASGTRSLPPARSRSLASTVDSLPATALSARSSDLATSAASDCHAAKSCLNASVPGAERLH